MPDARSFKFLTYQLSTVGYWPTVALTGNGELGFDSGEGARETATTSKEGSRRANYPILTHREVVTRNNKASLIEILLLE